MTRLGTAFIDVHPDFSNFDRLVSRKLAGSFKDAGEQSGRDFTKGFESNASGLLRPLDRELDDFSANLRTKIRTPQITTPKIAAPKIPTPRVPTPSAPTLPALDLSQTGRLDIQTAGAEADVARLKAHITELAAQTPTVEVKVAMAKAIADLDRAEAKVRDLDGKRAEIKVDVDRSLPGVFATISASAQNLVASLSSSGGGGGGIGGATARVSAGFLSFGSVVGPLAALLGTLAVTIGVSLVGALAALASSLALAAAGAGALGAALVGVLGVSGALAIAVGSRLTKVLDALKASDLARDQASQNALAGSQAAAAGAAAQEAATRALANAQRGQGEAAQRLKDATSTAYREMADAAEAASDAVRGVTTAQDSLASAKLSIRENELELEKFRGELGATGQAFGDVFNKFTDVAVDTSGLRKAITDAAKSSGASVSEEDEVKLERLILNVRDAKNREKDAIDGVSDAQRTAARAQQTDNEFKRRGIAASQGYASALKGVQTASLALVDAQRQVRVAQEGKGFSAAQAKALDLTNKLTEKERELLKAIQTVRTELKGAFKGATDAVFGGMITALGRVPALVNPLRASFTRLGESWGKALDVFSADLIKPGTVNSLRAFTDGAARLTGPIMRGLLSLFHIFLNIGKAALPSLVFNTGKVADHLGRWRKGTEDADKMGKIIRKLVGHTKAWVAAFAAVGRTILAFFGVAAPQGKDLAGSIKALADNTTVWLNKAKNQEKVRDFLRDAGNFAKDFVGFMGRLIEVTTRFSHVAIRIFSAVIEKMGGAKNATDALVFTVGTLAALKFAKGLIGGARDLRDAYRSTKRAATLMHESFVNGNAITRTAGKVMAGFRAILDGTALAAGRQKAAMIASKIATIAMTGATKLARAAQIAFNFVLTNSPIGRVIFVLGLLGAALVTAYQKSATFRRIVDGAFSAVKTAATVAIRAVLWYLDKLMGAWSSMLSALGHIPGFGWAKRAAASIDHAREKVRGLADSLTSLPKITSLKVIVDAELSPAMRKLLRSIEEPGTSKITKRPPVRLHGALGGLIPGNHDRDDEPIFATPGEFLTRKLIVKRIGPTVFADINAGRLDPRVGYQDGDRPAVRAVPVQARHLAAGGLVGARATQERPNVTNVNNFTVPGGQGPPDGTAAAVAIARVTESRWGGDVRQD